jgi:hypothetical protein
MDRIAGGTGTSPKIVDQSQGGLSHRNGKNEKRKNYHFALGLLDLRGYSSNTLGNHQTVQYFIFLYLKNTIK